MITGLTAHAANIASQHRLVIRSNEYPPNYEAITKVFNLTGYKPIFCWSPWIFNPHKVAVPPELMAHEQAHADRQVDGPAAWWERYLADDQFRLIEEIAAHTVEYLVLCQGAKDRAHRRRIMSYVANRLCSPIYHYQPRLPADRARSWLKLALKEAGKSPL